MNLFLMDLNDSLNHTDSLGLFVTPPQSGPWGGSGTSSTWSPTVMDYGDGFYLFIQGYWMGRPDWDTSPRGRSGGVQLQLFQIKMNTKPCEDGTGCIKLQLNYGYGAAFGWYTSWFPNTYAHEKAHANLFHGRFVRAKNYAISKALCYRTNAEAACWKDVAENKMPKVQQYRALLENYAVDRISSGVIYSETVAAEASSTADLTTAEATCTALATP
ncbi:MAG: hypothetical protein WCO77_06440 [bacterium]